MPRPSLADRARIEKLCRVPLRQRLKKTAWFCCSRPGPRADSSGPARLTKWVLLVLRYEPCMLTIVAHDSPEFGPALARLACRGELDFEKVEGAVRTIIADVRTRGDAAVRDCIQRFEHRSPALLFREDYGGAAALARLSPETRGVLVRAADRITRFHERQRDAGFRYVEDGVTLGTRTQPVERAAVYAPGGKARYPSSVLMAAIPARIAGVRSLFLVTPLADDAADDLILAAAHLSGVTAVVDAGGAQAIAAVAYGTESIPRVDKVVGPGNIYVATAKRLVFGAVSIDSIAGPSEILVLADHTANARVVAADLLSQAEHDEAAYALLACTSHAFAEAVARELTEQIESLPRGPIAATALRANGLALVVQDRDALVSVANRIAAEHLSIQTHEAQLLADRIERAGAIFVGHATPEAAGDYFAGPSHVLPTGGAVRFGSPLGVYDFMTRSSIIAYEPEALVAQSADIQAFARLEGLEAHARAVAVRVGQGRP